MSERRVFGLIVSHVVHKQPQVYSDINRLVSGQFLYGTSKTPRAAERTNRSIPAEESRFTPRFYYNMSKGCADRTFASGNLCSTRVRPKDALCHKAGRGK